MVTEADGGLVIVPGRMQQPTGFTTFLSVAEMTIVCSLPVCLAATAQRNRDRFVLIRSEGCDSGEHARERYRTKQQSACRTPVMAAGILTEILRVILLLSLSSSYSCVVAFGFCLDKSLLPMLHPATGLDAFVEVSNDRLTWTRLEDYKPAIQADECTVYIEARSGQRFRMCIEGTKAFSNLRHVELAIYYYCDGHEAANRLVRVGKNVTPVKGIEVDEKRLFPFVFGDVRLHAACSPKQLTERRLYFQRSELPAKKTVPEGCQTSTRSILESELTTSEEKA